MQLGNGAWESTQFNNRLQPTQIALGSTQNATDKLKLNFDYGATANNGNVLSQTITVPTVGTNQGFTAVQNYAYDSLNRIKEAAETIAGAGQSWKQSFTYDRYGNRRFDETQTTTLPKGCLDASSQPAVCAADRKVFNPSISATNNQLVKDQDSDQIDDYLFDTSGNTTKDAQGRTFIYDGENKQTEVKDSQNQTIGQYFYDGDGKRVKKISNTETVIFVYDAAGKLVAEYANQTEQATPQVSYLTADHLGSPRVLTDANGNVISRRDFHPFGEEIYTAQRTQGLGYTADTVRQKFTSYERDNETDLDYAQARMHSYQLGRFTSPDDFLKDSLVSEPQSWNKYVYARNNPLKYIDPEGEKATVTIETDEKNKTVTIKVHATIAYYGEKGVSNKDRDKAAQDASQNIANAWSGTFKTKDGLTVKVQTTITYKTVDTKEEAEKTGFQNVVGFTNGEAIPGKANSTVKSGGVDILSEKPDYGRWNIKTVNNTGDPEHEFGHLLGVGDREKGNELMNTNIHNNPSNSKTPTSTDFNWAFGGEIDSHRRASRPTTWSNRMQPSYGKEQNDTSTRILRAGRLWWN